MRFPFRILSIWAVMLAVASPLQAQNEMDALRYSSFGLAGTARSLGAGGAFSAVGADFSAVYLNPAGLGLYNRSELMFTPQLQVRNTEASYMGETGQGSRTHFTFSNVGYVHQQRSDKFEETQRGVRSWAVAIGFNQTDNYFRNISVSAFNPLNSISDYYATTANGVLQTNIGEDYSYGSLGWNMFLIDTSGVDGFYEPTVADNVQQTISIEQTGRKNEWSLAAGGNLNDFIYFGGAVGVVTTKFTNDLVYEEDDINNVWQTIAEDTIDFSRLVMLDYYRTRGTGFNARAGIIIRPNDFLRIGFSFTSPTWNAMNDAYITRLSAWYDGDPQEYFDELPEGRYRYRIITPYRVTTGATFIYKKLGFVSADFEFQDYTTARLKSAYDQTTDFYYPFTVENQAISDLFRFNYNMRFGAELRLGLFRLRGGYARYGAVLTEDAQFYADPFGGNSAKINASRQFFTGGFGFKQESFYLDLAFIQEATQDRQLFYTVTDPEEYNPELITKNATTRLLMTIGFTF